MTYIDYKLKQADYNILKSTLIWQKELSDLSLRNWHSLESMKK